MLGQKWFPAVIGLVVLLTVSSFGGSAFAEEKEDSTILKKGHTIKRLIKHSMVPYRHGMALPKTGQSVSYSAGDDGDFQRGAPWPEPRFIDHGNGTITDKNSGLMWTKSVGQIALKMNWHEALESCNNLVFAGQDDWRMPNLREMLSLIDFGTHNPALPEDHPFVNVDLTSSYWSSTTSSPHVSQAWRVVLKDGSMRRTNKGSGSHFVWPVRRGRQRIW